MDGACGTYGGRRGAYRVLVMERDHLETYGRWNDIIKMDLQEVEWGDMDCVALAVGRDRWGALVNTLMNLRVP